MNDELKPCPFCGNPKPIRATKFAYGWKVSCRCGAKMSHFATEEKAIAAWNTRTARSQ